MNFRIRTALAPVLGLLAVCAAACLDPDSPGNLVRKTVTEDPSLPRLQVNGTVLHAESFGNPANPLVLVLHGGPGGDYRALLSLQALAADGYRVAFWDQRGTGLSQRHDPDAFTWPALLEDLRQVIDHYASGATQPLVFIGHSWGAMYATWFINQYGDYGGRVRGAVLSEPGGFTKAQLDAYMKRLTGGLDFLGAQVNDATWIGQYMSATDHARADYMSMMMLGVGELPPARCDPNNPEPKWRSGAVASKTMYEIADRDGFDWTTNLNSFAPLVLFLRGDLNEANRLQDQQEMAAAYANAQMVTMRDVGHCMIWERPTEYLQHVRDYFQAIGFAGGQP
jgi:proline iminopeptidase